MISHLTTGRAVAVCALLILIGVSCSSGSPAASNSNLDITPTLNAAQSGDATAGAIGRSTREARATQASAATATRAVEQVTELAQTSEAATEMVRAQTAATATVAAQATGQAVLAAKSGWPSLIKDSFSDNQLGWPLGLTQDHSLAVTSTIADGSYQWTVTVKNGNSYFNLIPTKGPVLTDFYALVTVQFAQGNDEGGSAYGLTFRQVKDDYGFFGILKSGAFRALEVHDTGIYETRKGTTSAIHTGPGQTNRLAVVGIGSDFVFLVNDQPVSQLTAEFGPGQIGLGVDTSRGVREAQVMFTDFEVRSP